MRRFVLIGIPLIVIGGIGGYWYYWTVLAEGLQRGFQSWVEQRRSEGVEVGHGVVEVTGFPYRLELHIPAPALSAPKLTAAPAWSADKLTLYFQTWEKGHGIASIEGVQKFAWTEGTVRRNAGLSTERTLASFRFTDRGEITRLDTDMHKVAITGSVVLRSAERLQGRGEWRMMESGDRAFDLKLRGEVLKVDPEASPLGEAIDLADLAVEAEPLPASVAPEDLDAWRDAGGVLQISRLDIRTGQLSVSGDGTFALDAERRPEGAAALTVRGADAFVDAVAAAGQLGSGARLGLRLAIAALEETDSEGQQFFRVPIALQQGRLKILGVGLSRVEPLY